MTFRHGSFKSLVESEMRSTYGEQWEKSEEASRKRWKLSSTSEDREDVDVQSWRKGALQGRQRENLSQVGHCERKGAGKFSATAKIIPVPETTPFLS